LLILLQIYCKFPTKFRLTDSDVIRQVHLWDLKTRCVR